MSALPCSILTADRTESTSRADSHSSAADDPEPDGARSPLAMGVQVDILNLGGLPIACAQPDLVGWLKGQAAHALSALGLKHGELCIALVDDNRMAAEHLAHCGIPGTTDVLTFDMSDETGGGLDADLLLCLDEAARQSSARGHPIEHELLLYLVHGVLHCVGYDDHDEASAQRMHAREDEVFRELGLVPLRVWSSVDDAPSAGGGAP